MKIFVLIPTHNEARTIGWLIGKIKSLSIDEVVVIDDGSIDNTYEVASRSGATVLRNIRNLGKGAALKIGFEYCLNNSCDAVITMDGDGQHNPDEIPSLIESAKNLNADVLLGNRMYHTKDMPFVRFLTNRFMSAVISSLLHQHIPDTQCGFRFLSRRVLEKLSLKSSNFEVESEILIQSVKKGFKIRSIPIKTIYSCDIVSRINPFLDTLRFLRFILKTVCQ